MVIDYVTSLRHQRNAYAIALVRVEELSVYYAAYFAAPSQKDG